MPKAYFGCVCVWRPPRRCLSSAAYPRAGEIPSAVSQGEEEAGQTVTAPPGMLLYTVSKQPAAMWPVSSVRKLQPDFRALGLLQDRAASSQHDDRLHQEAEAGCEGRSRDGTGRRRRGNTAGTS